MFPRSGTILAFVAVIFLSIPYVIAPIAFKQYDLNHVFSYRFLYPTYYPTEGLGLTMSHVYVRYGPNAKVSQLKTSNPGVFYANSVSIYPDWTFRSIRSAFIKGLSCVYDNKKILNKASANIYFDPQQDALNGEVVGYHLFNTKEPLQVTLVAQSLNKNLAGHILITLPNIILEGESLEFQPFKVEFNQKKLWWLNQTLVKLSQASLTSRGHSQFETAKMNFDFKINDLSTESLPIIKDYLKTQYHGKGEGILDWSDEDKLDYTISAQLDSQKGQFLAFNPDKIKKNMDIVDQLLKSFSFIKDKPSINSQNIFLFTSSHLQVYFDDKEVQIKNAQFKKPDKSLSVKGVYGFKENNYIFRVFYTDKATPTPLSFSVQGEGDEYNIELNPIDLLNALPDVILPPIKNIFEIIK